MFGEKFLNFAKDAVFPKKEEPKKIIEKGSLDNPYSNKEFEDLKRERLQKESLVYFDGYVNTSSLPKNDNIQYFNFVEKDSDNYTVNLSRSYRRARTCLSTTKKEDGSFDSARLSAMVKDGATMKDMNIKIYHDLTLGLKKELVDDIYRKIDSKCSSPRRADWNKQARDEYDQQVKEDITDLVKSFVRKKLDISDTSKTVFLETK